MTASLRFRIPAWLAVVTLLSSSVFAPAGFAQEPGLLYGTAEMGTKLVAFNLEAGRVRVIGDTGFSKEQSSRLTSAREKRLRC